MNCTAGDCLNCALSSVSSPAASRVSRESWRPKPGCLEESDDESFDCCCSGGDAGWSCARSNALDPEKLTTSNASKLIRIILWAKVIFEIILRKIGLGLIGPLRLAPALAA